VSKIIGSKDVATEEIIYHASCDPSGNYDTLCGVSLSDDMFEPVHPSRGQKITCDHCYRIWLESRRYKASDFD
jgi:hypothetical protein